MRTALLASVLLVGVVTVGGPMVCAQQSPPPGFRWSSTDVAITFSTERSKVTPSTSGNFWFRGGSADAAFNFYHGLGVAGNVSVQHAANVAPGVTLDKVALMAGPRYTFRAGSTHANRFFVESLFGVAIAYHGVFPTSTGVSGNARSYSMQLGGGWDISVSKHFAIRPIEMDYVRTGLPNNGTNSQDHLRLAFGVSYHLQRH